MDDFVGRYCMVRTRSAGVFAGTIEKMEGATAILRDARRVWAWVKAATLSQLATEGTGDPEGCKLPAPVPEVMLLEVIEIIPISEKAAASIASIPEWRA